MKNTEHQHTFNFRWLINQLRQPFPNLMERRYNWLVIIGVSLFIAIFLWFFRPFGLNNATIDNINLFILGYGGVTFGVLTLFIMIIPAIYPTAFSNKKWTVGKHIIWVTLILLGIGSGNYAYTYIFIDSVQWHWKIFFFFQLNTVIIGVIPVAIVTLIDVNHKLKKNLATATNLNQEIDQKSTEETKTPVTIQFSGKNKNETLRIEQERIYYICSEGNYVQIFYKDQSDIHQKMLRNTLQNISQQLPNTETIVQCHRAYLVNINKIINAEGNAQGFKLQLKDIDEKIPVSRKYVPSLRESLSL